MNYYAEAMWDYMEADLKFSVDVANRYILVNQGVTELNIKFDIYRGLKVWYSLVDNSRHAFPIRSIGGDPTPGDQFAGDIYFMINNYKVVYDPSQTRITGVLYSDDADTAWLSSGNTAQKIYPAQVSNLVLAVQPSLDGLSVPTAVQNAAAVRTELTTELAEISNIDTTVAGEAVKTTLMKKILQNKSITDKDTGIMTIYDDDDVTPLYTCNIYEDATTAIPYAGNAVNRRERFE